MEQLKSAHRPFKVQNASVNSLTNGCDYYRIRVSSDKKSSGRDHSVENLLPTEMVSKK